MSDPEVAQAPEPGACGDPDCHVLHADPANPIHPPWWKGREHPNPCTHDGDPCIDGTHYCEQMPCVMGDTRWPCPFAATAKEQSRKDRSPSDQGPSS